MNPYFLHLMLIGISLFAIVSIKPTKPTDNQMAVLACLTLFAYSFNLSLIALFSSTHDLVWLSFAWLPFVIAFGASMWGLWKS